MQKIELLKNLYAKNSKHSNYQILPERLAELIGSDEIEVKSRFEKERLNYFSKHIDFLNKSVLDIGGNSGYFSFELLAQGAKRVHYYEGDTVHSEFVKLSAEVLSCQNSIEITNDYFLFDGSHNRQYDVVLCLNVLHHLGDDYGDRSLTIEKAKKEIIQQLNSLADKMSIMIFQLGFNWQGNRNVGLFNNGTKTEMIDFISDGVKDHWEIVKIGIAESIDNRIDYFDLNDRNIERDDPLGEFLNRPIFILKSKKH